MEYEELKQWLDWHVDSLRDQRDHAAFNSQIETTTYQLMTDSVL